MPGTLPPGDVSSSCFVICLGDVRLSMLLLLLAGPDMEAGLRLEWPVSIVRERPSAGVDRDTCIVFMLGCFPGPIFPGNIPDTPDAIGFILRL